MKNQNTNLIKKVEKIIVHIDTPKKSARREKEADKEEKSLIVKRMATTTTKTPQTPRNKICNHSS